MNYYLLQDNGTRGPYTIGQLRSMWNSGAITAETLHCQEGDEAWKPLRRIICELEPPPLVRPTPAKAPPTIIIQQPAPQKRGLSAGLGCIIIAVATVLIVIAIGISHTSKRASKHKVLNASVGVANNTLTVVNNGDFDWENVHVYLNGSLPDAYEAQFAVLRAGGRKELCFFEFTKGNDERFSGGMKVVEVQIWVAGYDVAKYPL